MGGRVKCEHENCGETFHHLADYRAHWKMVHSKTKAILPCSYEGCERVFLKWRSLDSHHTYEHELKLPGDEKSRIACEVTVSLTKWRKVVIEHLNQPQTSSATTHWMSFNVQNSFAKISDLGDKMSN